MAEMNAIAATRHLTPAWGHPGEWVVLLEQSKINQTEEDKLSLENKIHNDMEEARCKAIDNLAAYKFWMFGYWAAKWVGLNKLLDKKNPNPFRSLVHAARDLKARQ